MQNRVRIHGMRQPHNAQHPAIGDAIGIGIAAGEIKAQGSSKPKDFANFARTAQGGVVKAACKAPGADFQLIGAEGERGAVCSKVSGQRAQDRGSERVQRSGDDKNAMAAFGMPIHALASLRKDRGRMNQERGGKLVEGGGWDARVVSFVGMSSSDRIHPRRNQIASQPPQGSSRAEEILLPEEGPKAQLE